MPNKEIVVIDSTDVDQLNLFSPSQPQINRENYRPEQLRHQRKIREKQNEK